MLGYIAMAIQVSELVVLSICFAEMTKISSAQSAISSGLNVSEVCKDSNFYRTKIFKKKCMFSGSKKKKIKRHHNRRHG